MKETIIISLGGSLVVPNEIDIRFLKSFKNIILKHIKKKNFFLMIGGGRTCRKYQAALRYFTNNNTDIDWLGIYATHLNARLVKLIFKKYTHPKININPIKKMNVRKPILVAAGWVPGCSTDKDAVLLAKTHKVKTVINLTDQYFVFTKDPRKHKDAKPLKEINWKRMRKIVGNKWDPGKHVIFDPVAAKLAEKYRLKVIVTKGSDLKNLDKLFSGRPFKGTVIE